MLTSERRLPRVLFSSCRLPVYFSICIYYLSDPRLVATLISSNSTRRDVLLHSLPSPALYGSSAAFPTPSSESQSVSHLNCFMHFSNSIMQSQMVHFFSALIYQISFSDSHTIMGTRSSRLREDVNYFGREIYMDLQCSPVPRFRDQVPSYIIR